jgi:trans-aconitate methyltransferase
LLPFAAGTGKIIEDGYFMKKKMVLGIGFYRREQWPLLLETAADSQLLEKTYDDWMAVLDASIEKIRANGLEPELVDVDVEELLAFCKEQKLPNNSASRARFIAELALKKDKK